MKTGENSHSLGSLLMQRTKESGSNVFAYFKDQAVTLRQLNENSNRIANSLIRTGIKKTEKVAIISHSNLEYLSCEFGVTKAGAVCVPINCQLKSHELSYLLSNADVRLAIVHQNYLDEFLLAQDTGLEKIPYYLIDPDEKNKSIGIDALLESGESSDPAVDVDYADPCCIMYTSGTTGAPKGVVYEHYAILPLHEETYVQQMMDAIGLDSNDTTYLPFALYHILGQVHVVGALRNGGKIALAEKFSVTNFWNDVRKYGATVLVHQGASIPLLLKQIESKDDTQHKARLTVGAGVPSVEIWRRFEQRFRVKIFEHYAQTEGAFFGSGTVPTNEIGTIGKPFSSAEIRIIDDSEIDVKPGQPGQLISRLRPGTARKLPESLYYKEVTKSLARFTGEGWFKSGDIVRVDDRGYLHYVGKVETFIRYRGENISPLQIESILSTHPGIDECIAVGVANADLGGDDVKVVVVKKANISMTPHELMEWCQNRFPKYMIPRYVEFVPELKKTEQTKKVLRNEYKDNTTKTWDRLKENS